MGSVVGRTSVRVAILADSRASYVNPMAEGLARMVQLAGGYGEIFYDGLDALRGVQPPTSRSVRAQVRERARKMLARLLKRPSFDRLVRRLRSFDVVVVVQSIPKAFLRSFFWDEFVRALLSPIPIVLYDVFYLPTRGMWPHWLREGYPRAGIPDGGHWGLERYDWYLCASVVSELGLSATHHPVSLIGLHLDDGTLWPEQKNTFVALLDFEHPPDMHDRAVQITALEETDTPYVVLNGYYPTDQIRQIYRQTSIYFVAMRESFGL